MKKLVLLTLLILLFGSAFGQGLQKGNLIGTHLMTITLKPGVTMEQYLNFITTKYLPESNKADPDWQIYLLKSIRGNVNTKSIGLIHIIKSDKVRDKYINPDGSYTELNNALNEKLKPLTDELNKLGTYTSQWTDWIVQ